MDDVVVGGWTVDPGTRRALRLGRITRHLATQAPERAIVEAEELLDDDPRDPEGLLWLATASLGARDFLVAREGYEALLDAPEPPAAWIYAQLALCCFELADPDAALDAAERAVAAAPDLAEGHYLLGLCLERRSGDAAAEPHFLAAHQRSPLGFPLPLQLDTDGWREVVGQAFQALPPDLQDFWQPVPLRLVRFPAWEALRKAVPPISPRAAALYEGDPPEAASEARRPTAMNVFLGNLAHHESADAAVDTLLSALEQEALDWLPEEPG